MGKQEFNKRIIEKEWTGIRELLKAGPGYWTSKSWNLIDPKPEGTRAIAAKKKNLRVAIYTQGHLKGAMVLGNRIHPFSKDLAGEEVVVVGGGGMTS